MGVADNGKIGIKGLYRRLFGIPSASVSSVPVFRLCTFDSGFGGYLTAKAFERIALNELMPSYEIGFNIRHFGDTLEGVYGHRTPGEIAASATGHVINALNEGFDAVVMACNTASTQAAAVRSAADLAVPGSANRVLSIVEATLGVLKRRIDNALLKKDVLHLVFTSTPATLQSRIYVRGLAAMYPHSTLQRGTIHKHNPGNDIAPSYTVLDILQTVDGRTLHIYQLAPGTWVDLIENGADLRQWRNAAVRDVGYLSQILPSSITPDGLGEFCTHYPLFFGPFITALSTFYAENDVGMLPPFRIRQSEALARMTAQYVLRSFAPKPRRHKLAPSKEAADAARTVVHLSGTDSDSVLHMARLMFPGDPPPQVVCSSARAGYGAVTGKEGPAL